MREMNQQQIDKFGAVEPERIARFGALEHLLPAGYIVVYLDSGHSVGLCPDGREFPIHWNRWASFNWCRDHAAETEGVSR